MTRWVEIITKKKFTIAALDADSKTFMMHIAAPTKSTIMSIYLSRKALVALLANMEIPAKYSNFLDIFSLDSMVDCPKYIEMNNHFINLLKNKQLPHSLIYSMESVELKILKTYIKANLASNFIWSSKYPANTPILFV